MLPGLLVLLGVAAVILTAVVTWAILHGLLHPPRKTYGTALARGLATDPGEMGLAFEPRTFTFEDGTETPAWLITGQRAEGPLVVMVHGFGDSRYGALTWAPLILPHASAVVVYDLRGHGEATSGHATCGTRDLRDVHAILDQVEAEALARGVVLFGYSMGGGIAIASAAAEPARVSGVIADGPYRHWDEPIKRYLRNRRYPTQPFVSLAGLVLHALVPGFADFDRLMHAKELRRPLLVLHGSHDHLCPFASAKELAEAAPQGRLVVFAEGGHLDLAAVDPERYRAALAAFFADLSRTTNAVVATP